MLLAALGGAAALALEQSTAAPAASISPTPSGPPSPEPTPGVVTSSETSFTAVIDEQDVRLELPGGDVSGVAVFFPGSADVPAN
ncbi:MAG TPA: hypothetical protein VFY91_05420, partial [Microbacterium sp.]|nr:hypothetical protein [Microbacterium sp.]